jgi:hypothetical protein
MTPETIGEPKSVFDFYVKVSYSFSFHVLFASSYNFNFAHLYIYILIHMQDAKGGLANLGIYKGKVLLIVNVASQWYLNFVQFFLLITFPLFQMFKKYLQF